MNVSTTPDLLKGFLVPFSDIERFRHPRGNNLRTLCYLEKTRRENQPKSSKQSSLTGYIVRSTIVVAHVSTL